MKAREKIDETKSWFFEKINKIDELLAKLTKAKQEKTQINKIRSEREVITTDTTALKKNEILHI